MTTTTDKETGEIISAGMAPKVAAAIVAVQKRVKAIGYDERNQYGKYNYVSADKFFSTFGPLLAEEGLALIMQEESVETRQGTNPESGKQSTWLHTKYGFTLVHTSGAVYGPLFRSITVVMTGPQAYGSAQTYLEKQFLRALFMVPTGEKDADDSEQQPVNLQPSPPPTAAPAKTAAPASSASAGPTQNDMDYARNSYSAIRQQIAQAGSLEDVEAVMNGNAKQLEDIKRIAGEPHWQKLVGSAAARKEMLAPEPEPVP